MNRHLLVATDDSSNARKALAYAADLYRDVPDVDVTVITIVPPLPAFLAEGAASGAAEKQRLLKLSEYEALQERQATHILDTARRVLEKGGIPADRIHARRVAKSRGTVPDLLAEARKGRYDTLVVGRRSLGRVASYVMGSVTYGLVQQLHDLPLWLVDTPARSRRVLLALDNCEPCLKVVDHAAHMLAGIPGLELTILHVIPRFQPFFSKADTVALDALDSLSIRRAEATLRPLLERASGILREAGVDPGAVSIKVKRGGTSAYKEILTEFRGGGFGTLVVGRRGVGGWEALFPGSVSDRLLHGLRNGALWVVA